MFDPLMTHEAPPHHSPLAKVLSVIAVIGLLIFVYVVLNQQVLDYMMGGEQEAPVGEKGEPEVVPPPTPEEMQATSILDEDTRNAFTQIQEKVNKGEVSREEGERQIKELIKKIPVPVNN
jgi:uncharacterized protein HemX